MPERQDEHTVLGFVEIVEGDVARAAARNDQLAQTFFARTADEWMALQHCERIEDDVDRFACRKRVFGSEKLEQSIKICACALGEDYPRHRFARSLRPRPLLVRAA